MSKMPTKELLELARNHKPKNLQKMVDDFAARVDERQTEFERIRREQLPTEEFLRRDYTL